MTPNDRDELITEAALAIRKLQIAFPKAYQEAESVLTSITALRARLEDLVESDPYYTSHRLNR
jgi:hypothetical protein